MSAMTCWGIFCMGFVFGYLLYYAVRHTKEFNIDLLSSAIGAVGGGVVIALFGKTEGWIGPYGLGIGAGFIFYLVLSLILIFTGNFQQVAGNNVLLLSKTVLGTPRQE
jgi:hypothetical protein